MVLLIIFLAYWEANADNPNISINSLSLMQDAKGKGKKWAMVYLIGSKNKSENGFSDNKKLQKLSSTHKMFGSVVEPISKVNCDPIEASKLGDQACWIPL